ncbi:hypothetical protein QIL89_gp4 [ssRNA phage Esthiorhiza.4_1]|uniref:Uncharacterized protein n=2 Tax=unclassified Fiersviridae TaxID=2852980 RepID=A0A8S5L3H8_9VIRU|nr:hypothetical protein QIL89_gp4 [ssRNA phage Esthiorhiza.4_1]QDH88273.1 MAG: hypothetical protein H4RhizoLitter19220_000004 [Leviviridae sp.]DAD51935.1 TPA_asm: hypothetical protein [ssRNA phage Esthiorhiza.4_1]
MAFVNNPIAPRLSGSTFWDDSVPGVENWLTYLLSGSNQKKVNTVNPTDPLLVERVKTTLLRRFNMKVFYWLLMENSKRRLVYRSADFPHRDFFMSEHRYISLDYLPVKSVSVFVSKYSEGRRLEGMIRLPFHQDRLSNGRFEVIVKMTEPSCRAKGLSLLRSVTQRLSAGESVERKIRGGFTEA